MFAEEVVSAGLVVVTKDYHWPLDTLLVEPPGECVHDVFVEYLHSEIIK